MSSSLTFFGTGSHSNVSRNNSGIGYTFQGKNGKSESWLFDCGDATVTNIYHQNTPCTAASISRVFITHLHLDHVGGLASLLSILCNGYLKRNNSAFKVYGPRGIAQLLTSILFLTDTHIGIPIAIYEFLNPGEELSAKENKYSFISVSAIYPDTDGYWTVFSNPAFTVRSGRLIHGVRCHGYCIEKKVGHPEKVAIFGDTCDSSHMNELVLNCDVLVHEATVGPILSDINRDYLDCSETEWKAIQNQIDNDPELSEKWNRAELRAPSIGHSTIKQAAQFAQKVHAKKLCLVHIGGRYQAKSEGHKRAIREMMRFEAGRYFEGTVEVGEDGMILNV